MSSTGSREPPKRIRKYAANFTGPFVVIAEATEGSLSTAKLSALIHKDFGVGYMKAVAMSRRKTKILMENRNDANALICKEYPNTKLYIPQRFCECLGVAYIDPEVSESELDHANAFDKAKVNQDKNISIVETRRITRKVGETTTPLWAVVFTFSGTYLPTHVEFGKILYPIKPYVYPIRQCRKCWRFAHHENNCRSAKRCNRCTQTPVTEEHECTLDNPKCINCSGEHAADERNKCPMFAKKREEMRVKQSTFSQGKPNWFEALAHPPTSIEASSSPAVFDNESFPPLSHASQISESCPKRPRVSSISGSSISLCADPPQLQLCVENKLDDVINESLQSRVVDETIQKIKEMYFDADEEVLTEILETYKRTATRAISDGIQDFIRSLRL